MSAEELFEIKAILGYHITPPRRTPQGPYPIITPEYLLDGGEVVHQTRTGILTGSDQRVRTRANDGVLTVEDSTIAPTSWCTQTGSVFSIDAVITDASAASLAERVIYTLDLFREILSRGGPRTGLDVTPPAYCGLMDSAGSGHLREGFGGDTPAAVLADLASAIGRAQALSDGDLWDHETRSLVAELEVAARRIDATRVAMLSQVNRSGLHHVDGHASPKVLIRHRCRLSASEAARRERQERALRHLTLVADAYRAGSVGTEQVDLVALVYANPRVREALVEFQPDLLILATECEYPVFEDVLRRWARLVDTDGPDPRGDTAHKNRHLSLHQDPETLAWRITGSLGPLQGAKVQDILRRLADQARLTDWDEAKAVHGDSTCVADLERTEAQRWADSLERMAELAASADPGAEGPGTEHVIVWDADTYLSTVHRVTCTDPHCDAEAHGSNRWYDPATYRCENLNGRPLEPVEAMFDSFHHHVRIVLVTGGQPTHVGSKRRLFTGRNRLAVKLQSPTCIWPGCWVPTSVCESDHAHPHERGGKTEPENGVPLCGRHNRWKQKNYTTRRDPDTGRWRTYRPDGTEIE